MHFLSDRHLPPALRAAHKIDAHPGFALAPQSGLDLFGLLENGHVQGELVGEPECWKMVLGQEEDMEHGWLSSSSGC